MKRNIFVGIGAAVLGLLLISLFMYLELRYTENGAFLREWAATGAPDCRHGDPFAFMARWVRINEFVLSPSASLLVGSLVGCLCRARSWLALLIGVAPIVAINYHPDVLSVTSDLACIFVAWLGAKSAQAAMKHFPTLKGPGTARKRTIRMLQI